MTRIAIVTGSNRGIGAAIAARLEHDGYRVVRNGRSPGRGDYVRADVSTPSGAKRLAAAAPRCDVLINNVGDFFFTPVSRFQVDAWERLLSSNLRSAWLMCARVLPGMRRRKSGVIVNIGGTATQFPRANPRAVGYTMAKTALLVFSKSLAQAEAARNIRVNVVNPGFIHTYAYSKKDVAEMAPKVPAGRLGTPEEVAAAVAWLASDEARYVTGAVLDVGGGLWI